MVCPVRICKSKHTVSLQSLIVVICDGVEVFIRFLVSFCSMLPSSALTLASLCAYYYATYFPGGAVDYSSPLSLPENSVEDEEKVGRGGA